MMWTSDVCPDNILRGSITITERRYTINHLRGSTSYNIIVSGTNSAGTVYSDTVTGETQEIGQ